MVRTEGPLAPGPQQIAILESDENNQLRAIVEVDVEVVGVEEVVVVEQFGLINGSTYSVL